MQAPQTGSPQTVSLVTIDGKMSAVRELVSLAMRRMGKMIHDVPYRHLELVLFDLLLKMQPFLHWCLSLIIFHCSCCRSLSLMFPIRSYSLSFLLIVFPCPSYSLMLSYCLSVGSEPQSLSLSLSLSLALSLSVSLSLSLSLSLSDYTSVQCLLSQGILVIILIGSSVPVCLSLSQTLSRILSLTLSMADQIKVLEPRMKDHEYYFRRWRHNLDASRRLQRLERFMIVVVVVVMVMVVIGLVKMR
jgi:hypothetical protein